MAENRYDPFGHPPPGEEPQAPAQAEPGQGGTPGDKPERGWASMPNGMPYGPPPGFVPPPPWGPPPGACLPPYGGWGFLAPPPPRRRRLRAGELALIALSMAVVVLLALILGALASAGLSLGQLVRPAGGGAAPPSGSFSVIRIQGEIASQGSGALGINDPSYHHAATLAYIKSLAESENDQGILLYMNTPGGGVYESDEIYRALMDYREKTGRPVWAYMARTCASGGYYICMGAEKLLANYNTTTGSIGVYIALTDTSRLYGKLGIQTVLVRSGENKGVGTPGVAITQEQRDIFQATVDESYERFVQLIVEGRQMPRQEVLPLADGRIYTASQALENGLVDELTEWDGALEVFEKETGATAYYPNFSRQTWLGSLISDVLGSLPQGENEAAFQRAEALPQGVPLAYAYELA